MSSSRRFEDSGCLSFEVATLTDDGHRLSSFGATAQQATRTAHEKATDYPAYDFVSYCTSGGGAR